MVCSGIYYLQLLIAKCASVAANMATAQNYLMFISYLKHSHFSGQLEKISLEFAHFWTHAALYSRHDKEHFQAKLVWFWSTKPYVCGQIRQEWAQGILIHCI